MNAKSNLFLMLVAGSAISSAAMAGGNDPNVITTGLYPRPDAAHTGHMYIDMKTGERSLTKQANTRAGDFSVYNANGTHNATNYFFALDDPARTAQPPLGTEALAWGDCEMNMTVDQVVCLYATGVPDTGTNPNYGVVGYNLVIRLYDAESGTNDPDALAGEIVAITVTDIPGSPIDLGGGAGFYFGWILTLNFATDQAFEIGDTDGFDAYGNVAGLTGIDEDEDGKADFGWSYQFEQHQPVADHNACGPFICVGGNNGGYYDADGDGAIDKSGGIDFPLNSAGTSSHLWGWFTDSPTDNTIAHTGSLGNFRFGGSPPTGALWNIEFGGPVPGDSVLDLDGSGAFDGGDFFGFFGRFDIAGG